VYRVFIKNILASIHISNEASLLSRFNYEALWPRRMRTYICRNNQLTKESVKTVRIGAVIIIMS